VVGLLTPTLTPQLQDGHRITKSTISACGPSSLGNLNHPPIEFVDCIFCHVVTNKHWHVMLIIGGTGGTGVQVLHHGSQTF